jgi:hypothetical protein
MIKELNELPANVIGFEVTGKVLAQDFLDVVLPVFERASKAGGFEPSLSFRNSTECPVALSGRTYASASLTCEIGNRLQLSLISTG